MKETELKNTSETSEMEVQNLSGQDKARKHRKTAKAAISFIVMIVLLVALFFAASNFSGYFFSMKLFVFHLDIDANTSRHLQSCQSIHSFLCRSDDIDQSFMSSLLELLA